MTDKPPVSKKGFSADWFMQGALTKIGDSIDRLTGRKWIPSSTLATSELIERVKKLLDAEARKIPGKGTVVPHNIKLKMQWDKFSTDEEGALAKLENELLTAAVDHINDSLYYTYAPLKIEVKTDYFTEGVKLLVSFDKLDEDDAEVEMNVTLPASAFEKALNPATTATEKAAKVFIAHFEIKGVPKDRRLVFPADGRLSIGRTGASNLVIDDVSVSKIHASIVVDANDQLSVADTGSTNGTFINDQRIAYGKATRLVEGDRVKFGMVEVVFEHVPAPPEPEPEPEPEAEVDPLEMQDDEEVATNVDGFEFKKRVSVESPAEEPATSTISEDTEKIPLRSSDSGAAEIANAEITNIGGDSDGETETTVIE